MLIKLSPCRCDELLKVSKRGDVLTINGERFDFRALPEGAVLPASAVECDFVVGDVMRQNGELIITLLLPCGPDDTDAVNYPADIVSPPDGNVSLPK
ncbi:hypothetical protein [Pseudomonas simiae]|uniref:hypothetical protein n=1 Tax=Pseudomonas simiae TaxID=321846 RepID=UPI002095D07E|nr:hypothetical protein [Pseudomonas simiae]